MQTCSSLVSLKHIPITQTSPTSIVCLLAFIIHVKVNNKKVWTLVYNRSDRLPKKISVIVMEIVLQTTFHSRPQSKLLLSACGVLVREKGGSHRLNSERTFSLIQRNFLSRTYPLVEIYLMLFNYKTYRPSQILTKWINDAVDTSGSHCELTWLTTPPPSTNPESLVCHVCQSSKNFFHLGC